MAYTEEILQEARNLVAGNAQSVDLAILSRAFIAKRLANSSSMEAGKAKAMELLLKKLDDANEDWSASKLITIVELISEHTGRDLKALLDAQVAMSKAGNPAHGGGSGGSLFGAPEESGGQETGRAVPVRRETYKLLDGLVQVAEAVVHVSTVKTADSSAQD